MGLSENKWFVLQLRSLYLWIQSVHWSVISDKGRRFAFGKRNCILNKYFNFCRVSSREGCEEFDPYCQNHPDSCQLYQVSDSRYLSKCKNLTLGLLFVLIMNTHQVLIWHSIPDLVGKRSIWNSWMILLKSMMEAWKNSLIKFL